MLPGEAATDRRIGLLLALAVLSGLLLFAPGHLYTVDDETNYRLSETLVEQGTLAMQPAPDRHLNLAPGRDGALYAYYPPGVAWFGIPFYLVGRSLAGFSAVGGYYLPRSVYSLQGPVWGALIAVILFHVLRGLGASSRTATALALVHTFATHAFIQERSTSATLPAAAAILWAWGRIACRPDFRGGWQSGLLLSLALLFRYESALFWPFCLLAGWRFAGGLALGLLPGLLLAGLYNAVRFGLPWLTGSPDQESLFSGDLLTGLWGLTLGTNRGLLWFSPLSVLGGAGLLLLWRSHRRAVLVAMLFIVAQTFFIAALIHWAGGATWGPRYLGVLLPLLSVGLWPFWDRGRPWVKRLGIAAAVALQLFGATVSYDSWNDLLWDYGVPDDRSWRTFQFNPWFGQYELLRRVDFRPLSGKYARGDRPVPVGATPANQSLRRSLDYWPFYTVKFHVPWPLVAGLWLALAGLALAAGLRLRAAVRRASTQTGGAARGLGDTMRARTT